MCILGVTTGNHGYKNEKSTHILDNINGSMLGLLINLGNISADGPQK